MSTRHPTNKTDNKPVRRPKPVDTEQPVPKTAEPVATPAEPVKAPTP